jgi:hypothetical protein
MKPPALGADTCNREKLPVPGRGREMFMSETALTTRAPQRLQALERANEIRLARAELKRRIAYGSVSAAEVILAPPCEANSWAIGDLLLSQRRWGHTRCRKFLMRNQINETKPVGALTDRQRRMLADHLSSAVAREPALALAGV